MCLRASDRDESYHSSGRTWAMLFHTSPRCTNGMHIHIHSERFALYYTLFSDDVLRLKSVIRESRYSGCLLHRKHATSGTDGGRKQPSIAPQREAERSNWRVRAKERT
jgi:hypothetical protein